MGLRDRGVIEARWLGIVPYADGLAMQDELHRRRADGEVGDTLLQLEHPSVFTIGRRGSREDVLWDSSTLQERGVEVHEADRGGMVTYHGPGQLVGYPILDLAVDSRPPDLVAYLRDLEEALIRALGTFGVGGERIEGHSGVWVGSRKIAAVGVRVTRGVTKHGYALNVSPDLSFFGGIVPCGIRDRGVTSIRELTGDAPGVEAFACEVERAFGEVLGRRVVRAVRA